MDVMSEIKRMGPPLYTFFAAGVAIVFAAFTSRMSTHEGHAKQRDVMLGVTNFMALVAVLIAYALQYEKQTGLRPAITKQQHVPAERAAGHKLQQPRKKVAFAATAAGEEMNSARVQELIRSAGQGNA